MKIENKAEKVKKLKAEAWREYVATCRLLRAKYREEKRITCLKYREKVASLSQLVSEKPRNQPKNEV